MPDEDARRARADRSPEEEPGGSAAEPAAALPIERAGAWRLVRPLGRGGMGAVYLAARADGGFEQRAALKLLDGELDDPRVLERFERERQILAGFNHPEIAGLLDGGRTADGRPYFVMEYVDGERIDHHCDARRLGVDERLALFVRVCRGVAHAHHNLVVHRDLKPANIFVTGDGRVKLLDFGIAEILETEVPPEAPATRTLPRVLTPEYASPELLRGGPIGTASDVYQLGLLLYELLTGERAQRAAGRTPAQLERAILEREPPAPSAAAISPAAAAARGTTPQALARRLRGDLDTVTLTALRKEPERRYASAGRLADDVERFLARLPVEARGDAPGYRLRRFVARHRLGVGAGTAIGLLVVGYAATVTWQAGRLARQRDQAAIEARKARQVSEFLTDLFAAAGPEDGRGGVLTARDLLDAGVERVDAGLGGEPELLAEVLGTLGNVSHALGAYQRADELLTRAARLQAELHPTDHLDLARARSREAAIASDLGDLERGERLARDALAMRERLLGERHLEVADGVSGLAAAVYTAGRVAEAEALWRRELTLRRELAAEPDAALATCMNNLATALAAQARHAEAEALHREALALRRRLLDRDHPAVSESLNNLAVALREQGRLAEAEPLYREALESRRRVFGSTHTRVANTLNNLGEVLRRTGRLEAAAAAHSEALAIRRAALGEEHSNVAGSLHNLGLTRRDQGDLDAAEALLTRSLRIFRAALPAGHATLATSMLALGRVVLERGEPARAEALLREALDIRERAGLGGTPLAEAQAALALCELALGRPADARARLDAALPVLRDSPTADPRLVRAAAEAASRLARDATAGS